MGEKYNVNGFYSNKKFDLKNTTVKGKQFTTAFDNSKKQDSASNFSNTPLLQGNDANILPLAKQEITGTSTLKKYQHG